MKVKVCVVVVVGSLSGTQFCEGSCSAVLKWNLGLLRVG